MYWSTTNNVLGHSIARVGGVLFGVGTCGSGGSTINDRTTTAIANAVADITESAKKSGYNGVIGLTQSTEFHEMGTGLSTHVVAQCVLMGTGVVVAD